MREDRPYRAALRLHTGSSQPLIQTDLPLWAGGVNWSCFLPAPYRGYTFSCQSVARQVRCSRGCLRGLLTATNTARAQGRGIKGGKAPFAGGPGTRRFLVSLWLLSSHKKVTRGGGAERPPLGGVQRWALALLAKKKGPTAPGNRKRRSGGCPPASPSAFGNRSPRRRAGRCGRWTGIRLLACVQSARSPGTGSRCPGRAK